MGRTKRFSVMAGAALSIVCGGGAAMAQNAADAERAYAAELMADAAGRTSELAQRDRRFSVDVHGYFQFRYNWNNRDTPPDDDDDNTIGFQMARTRLTVSGNIMNEDWGYFIQFGATPDGDFILDDAYGTFRFETGWQFQFGQFRLPFSREFTVGETYQLAADRSVASNFFSLDRSQGVQLGFVGEQIRFAAAFSDGANNSNTDFTDTDADLAFTGRLDFKWAGDWDQARDFTSFPNSDFFGMVGVAGHWQTGGDTVGTTNHDLWAVTADVSVEGNGWNFFAAGHFESSDVSGDPTFDDMGLVAQGGLFVTSTTELFGRWSGLFPDSNWGELDNDFHTVAFGVNHYFVPESHAAKLTVDLQWFLDNPSETGPAIPNTLTGLLPDDGDNQWNLRAQLQVQF